MVSITVPVPVPYGAANANSIYVRKKSDGSEKNITYYHIGHNIVQKLNNHWNFTVDLVSVSATDKTDWLVKNNDILIFWGTKIRMKGRIEKITYDNYERCHIDCVGKAVKLKDQDIDEEKLNQTSASIITDVNDSIMTIDTNTNYGLISMSFQTENRLRALAGTAAGIDYDWWEAWKSADDYVTDYINVDDFKGDPDVTKMTFYTSGNSANMNVISEESDSHETTNYVTVLGAGDGVNQIKAVSFHATEDRTTLDKPLDAILNGDIDDNDTDLTVYDSSGIDSGDTIRVDGETMTVSSVPDSTSIIVAARTSKPAHVSGAEVIKTAGKIHCVATTSLPASGNVFIGQEKISYSANASNDLTITARAVSFINGRNVIAYYHGAGIEVYDAQYTKDSPDDPSYIDTDGIRSRTFTQTNIIQQNMADYLSQSIRIDRQAGVNVIKGTVSDAMDILGTEDLVVGDWVELSDDYTGFDTGTRYEVVGMIYGFDVNRGEYCDVEISNYNRTLLENTVKETDNLGKYYKGATNIFEVSDSENCDNTHPLVLPFRIPTNAVALNKVMASYSVEDYRAYSTTTSGGSAHYHDITGKSSEPEEGGYWQEQIPVNCCWMGSDQFLFSTSYKTFMRYQMYTWGAGFDGARFTMHMHSLEDMGTGSGFAVRLYNYTHSDVVDYDDPVDADMDDDGEYHYDIVLGFSSSGERLELNSANMEVQADADSDYAISVEFAAVGTTRLAWEHTHDIDGIATDNESSHNHTTGFAITDNTKENAGINITVDNGDGSWSNPGDLAGNPFNATKDQDIDITSLVGRETGWKKLRFTPTVSIGTGKCKITGIGNVQVFIQSKT